MPTKARHPIDQSVLYSVKSRARLALILRVSLSDLRRLSTGDANYKEFDMVKKSGGVRHIEDPVRPLKLLQAKIARYLGQISPPDFLFCPVKGRCYVGNAAAHRGNRVVQCVDLKKFFPNTPQRRVYWFFKTIMKCETDVAALLAALACYQGHLPTGSPLSPILAYFSYYDLWVKIEKFCRERSYKFTLYVDDLTISGVRVPDADMWQIRKLIHGYGLRYHKEKKYVDGVPEITGVMVRDDILVAPYRQHRKLHESRSSLRFASDADRPKLLGTVSGVVGQLRQIARKNDRPM